MFVFTVTLILLLQTLASEFPVLNAETTTEMVSLVPLSPGHADNSVSLKPAENIDRFTSSLPPTVVPGTTQTSTTTRPLESSTGATSCAPWFVCVHGSCRGGMSCSCYQGWAGLLCDEPCPENCAPYGTCVTSSSNQAVCVCDETSAYTPAVGCVEKPPEPPRSAPATASGEPAPSTATRPTAGDVTSLGDKDCFGIFTCVHGSCQAVSMACDCDRGWRGQLCDQPCELSCGEHGKCREKDFMQYCECDSPYTGDDCTTITSITVEASTAAPEPIPPITNLDLDFGDWFHLAKKPTSDHTTRSNTATGGAPSSDSRSSQDGTSTLRPVSQRRCGSGGVCQHGHCPTGQMPCLCDRGWGGNFCNQTCDLPCGENGTCVVHDGESPYCQCGPGHSNGRDCQQLVEESDPWHHLEEKNGQLPPLVQRLCLSGIICAHGNCSRHNGSVMTCSCEPDYTGPFCQYPCPLDCGQQGECTYDLINNTAQCECHFPYTGINCTDISDQETEESLPTAWIVCIASALFLLSVVMLIVLAVYLYKRQNITMMKIVHWFQPFEEDDCKEYDAFVSYSSSDHDRQFVLQTLVPRLEGRMCFTLCIHQRNFVAGQCKSQESRFISDNIVESVKRSRRTLLVVSPSFVSSGWCRFEYQTALQEMLSEKHRVLPIIIGDISPIRSQIDETLKSILRTVTWLEYPSKCSSEQEYEQFWKRLELSMPKKRSAEDELVHAQSCLASQTSALSTKDSKDEDALPSSYLMSNECSNTGLIQRIVRIPANREAFSDASLKSGSTALGNILEARQDKASQDGTVGSSVGNASSDSTNSEPHVTNSFSGESCPDSNLDNPETEAASHTPESSAPSDQDACSDTTSQCTHPKEGSDSNNQSSDEEDLPACMVENYLGNLEITNNVTV